MGIAQSVAFALLALAAGPRDEVAPQIATDRTYLTFSCPTRLPGASLAQGTYLFVTLRSVGGQSLVDVYTADASRHVARVLGIDSTGSYGLRTPATPCAPGARPIRGWYNVPYARDIELVYDRAEAAEISKTFGMQVPYSVVPIGDLDLVGAYPVAGVRRSAPLLVAGAGAMIALPIESSRLGALIERTRGTFGPVDHLRVARLIIAERAGAVARDRTALRQLGVMLDALQRAARERETARAARLVNVIAATIGNLNPPSDVLAKYGVLPPPRDFVLTLERIDAHVRAFTRATRPDR